MKRVKEAGATIVASVAMLALMSVPAPAHDVSVYYPRWWQSDLSVDWRFEGTFPSTNLRDRVKDGAAEWNSLPPVMHFDKQSGDYANFDAQSCPDTYQKDGIHWGNIDGQAGGTLAYVHSCWIVTTSELWNFQMKFDDNENWYAGTSSPPSEKLDMWSVAAHEFGHATGFSGPYDGHFDPNAEICTTSPETMCPYFRYGATYWRSLETHDVHTFGNRYP